MNTPICDFVSKYIENKILRLHMPGHKGVGDLGVEDRDITEIKGADSLFEANSIIKESEQNASKLFGALTYYSTEGSSLCIRAMLYLVALYAKKRGKTPLILAARNAHKAFISAVALNDIDVEWLYSSEDSYLSCRIDSLTLDKKLLQMSDKPTALYITSPDYLGNMADIKAIAEVCHKHGVLLLVDNAHGAYLKFMSTSIHPVDLGADMCCDSAHKTMPTLTGGAYLHISETADKMFADKAKTSLSLFASTSPSYLILQSLDLTNRYISDGYKDKLSDFVRLVDDLKQILKNTGYTIVGDEPLKVTISTKDYGYTGYDFADILRSKNIECEFSDPDFVVLMFTPNLADDKLNLLKQVLIDIPKKHAIESRPPKLNGKAQMMSIRKAIFSDSQKVNVKDSIGKVLSTASVSCPPAVPIVVSGELIDENALSCFEYYSIDFCEIVIE